MTDIALTNSIKKLLEVRESTNGRRVGTKLRESKSLISKELDQIKN
jgi:hypothetical protein